MRASSNVLTPSSRFILNVIKAHHYSGKGPVTIKTLLAETESAESTVRRSLKQLAKCEQIDIHRRIHPERMTNDATLYALRES